MKKTVLLLAATMISSMGFADVRLPNIFGDNMILQRDKPIPVWGWADKNEKITIQFNQQTQTVKADKNGQWKVLLHPEKAGGPYNLSVKGKKRPYTARHTHGGRMDLQRAVEHGISRK
jgi:sialate O-acetylesterase